jgi:flagellar biosynthesis/type III secretory pathway protein FliH
MSLSKLYRSDVKNEKVVIGEYRIDIEADQKAEEKLNRIFVDVAVLTSIEGKKLIPIQELYKLYEEARSKVVELIVKVSKKVTCDAARIDPEVTASIIKNTIDKLVDKSKIKVKVHPDHLPIIEQHIDRFKGESTAVKEIIIEADKRVRYGGCFIETPTGDIDARVESQLGIVTESIGEYEDES